LRLRSFGITHEKLGAESSKLPFCFRPLSASRHRLNGRSTNRMNRLLCRIEKTLSIQMKRFRVSSVAENAAQKAAFSY
jgi:hypothetical protein